MNNTYQMINRDTGLVVYEAEALGWRQFKIAYVQWAQTQQKGILPLELQEIKRREANITFTVEELRLILRTIMRRETSSAERAVKNKIQRFLEAQ